MKLIAKYKSQLFVEPTAKSKGDYVEEQALKFLHAQKLKLRTRNYNCKLGEIDLIMQDSEAIVFVEVRFRQNRKYGHPSETVSLAKQKKIIKTALIYLQEKKLLEKVSCRFDVLTVNTIAEAEALQFNWLRDAFQA